MARGSARGASSNVFGGVLAVLLIIGFLCAGLLTALLPLPRPLEGLRDPIGVAAGLGSIFGISFLAWLPGLLFRREEEGRLDRQLRGFLLENGQAGGQGRIYRATSGGRVWSLTCSLHHANPLFRMGILVIALPAPLGRFLAFSHNPGELDRLLTMHNHGHVLGLGLDVRADDAAFAKALWADRIWRPRLLRLLSAHPAARGCLLVEPGGLVLRLEGDSVLPFSDEFLAEVRDLLFLISDHLRQHPGRASGPGEDHLSLHPPGGPGIVRYILPCGCISLLSLAWLIWVGSVLWPLVWTR
jgi:hypothetical protein